MHKKSVRLNKHQMAFVQKKSKELSINHSEFLKKTILTYIRNVPNNPQYDVIAGLRIIEEYISFMTIRNGTLIEESNLEYMQTAAKLTTKNKPYCLNPIQSQSPVTDMTKPFFKDVNKTICKTIIFSAEEKIEVLAYCIKNEISFSTLSRTALEAIYINGFKDFNTDFSLSLQMIICYVRRTINKTYSDDTLWQEITDAITKEMQDRYYL